MKAKAIAIILGTLLGLQSAWGCTDFSILAQDGSTLIARTMEYSLDMHANLRSSNRGREFKELAPDGKPGLTWKAQYGYLFLDAFNVDTAVDGMNEAGLSIEALYLPGETQYQAVPANSDSQALPYLRLGDWVLSNFKSVEEVRQNLSKIYVYTQTVPTMGNMIFPLHFAIYDASGKGIIVEFVQGAMHIYDNKVGVLTNSPTYDWQVVNLRNYINLSPYTPNPIKFGNLIFLSTGQGSGMKGLPGDVSPPSRFTKIAIYKAAAVPARTAMDALNMAQHIINNVDIPMGVIRYVDNGKTLNETTQWTIFKDLTHQILYYHTYQDTTLHAVTLSTIDFSPQAARLKMSLVDNQFIINMNKQFMMNKG